jgi:pimeloyl-ACP methyl ester carboxylesterase
MAIRGRIEESRPDLFMPTSVIRGEKDLPAPQKRAEEMTKLLPRGKLKVMPGWLRPDYAAPLELVRAIQPFLIP